MGFGTIFTTIVFVVIIGITSYMFITGTMFSMDTLSNSLKKMNEIDNARLKTGIEIVNVSATNKSELSEINVSIDNTGTTKILNSNFRHIDVFIHYNARGTGNTMKWIPYNNTECGALQNNEWTVGGISPDLANPRIFDPDEEMKIFIRVYPAIEENSTNRVNVVTPNGVSASGYFQY